MPLAATLSNLTPRGRAALAASAIGVVLFVFFMMRLAGQPSFTTVMSGIDPAETGKVTAALDEKGIVYELRNNGTALAVDKTKTAQARVALAEQGLPARGQPGFELFGKQKLGTSEFQQKVTYQRALEGEVARTIEGVDGISSAQVRLALPEDELFQEAATPATAAVLLSAGANALEPSAVRGIAQLVASSVKGLKTSNVSITDQTGQLVWPAGDGSGTAGGLSRQAAETRYEQQLEASLDALLARSLGPGKAEVQVKAQLNTDEATRDELTYAKDGGVPLKTDTEEEQLEGGGGKGAAGPSGTAGNIPGYAQGAGGASSNYKRKKENTELGVDKVVTRTKVAPGKVERLDLALLLDQKAFPKGEQDPAVKSLKRAVASAAGIDAGRGDTLALSTVPFAKQPKEAPAAVAGPAGGMIGYAKYAVLGLATALFLFFVSRHLRRRESESIAEPTWLREINGPTSIAALAAGRATPPPPLPERQINPARHHVEQLAEREPDRVAQQVRAWMKDD